jgi:cytochrome c
MHRIALFAALLVAASLPFGPPAAAQDAAAGQRVFRTQCAACHTADEGGRNGVGPNLHGVVGRKAGSVQGFRYSANMQAKGGEGFTWTEENLNAYIANPKAVVPQGSMPYAGLRNDQQRDDLIAFLKSQS